MVCVNWLVWRDWNTWSRGEPWPSILNATDSDWGEHEPLMDELGVEVKQLCPQHAKK